MYKNTSHVHYMASTLKLHQRKPYQVMYTLCETPPISLPSRVLCRNTGLKRDVMQFGYAWALNCYLPWVNISIRLTDALCLNDFFRTKTPQVHTSWTKNKRISLRTTWIPTNVASVMENSVNDCLSYSIRINGLYIQVPNFIITAPAGVLVPTDVLY